MIGTMKEAFESIPMQFIREHGTLYRCSTIGFGRIFLLLLIILIIFQPRGQLGRVSAKLATCINSILKIPYVESSAQCR